MRRLRVAVVPGDGIGPEVVDATLPALTDAAARHDVRVEAERFDWGAGRTLRGGGAMPADGLQIVRGFDAVLFGAVGRPDVADHLSIWGLILALRQGLDLYLNLRPVKPWPGIPSVVRDVADVDFLIVRENSEGEYVGIGGRAHAGTPAETAIETAVHSRFAIERVARYAFEAARSRGRALQAVGKANALRHGYVLWDEVVDGLREEYADVAIERVLVDAMAARIVERPRSLSVVLASNLFGDILSDLAAVLAGGLGMVPSANVGTGGDAPGVFEPVHGSAPDIAGTGRANPVGCLLSAALLLEHTGQPEAGETLRRAVRTAVVDHGARTPDIGGSSSTRDVGEAVRRVLAEEPLSRE